MKTFITWSGDTSHKCAVELRAFLRMLFPTVEPFVSSEDIRRGTGWSAAITDALAEAQRGIACLTADNYQAPWVLFEAGALTKALPRPHLYTLLLDGLRPDDLRGSPLSSFQHTSFDESGMRTLVTQINEELPQGKRTEAELARAFDGLWQDLESKMRRHLGARRVIRIVEQAQEPHFLVAGRKFENAIIRGPAILHLDGSSRIRSCTFVAPNPQSMIWAPPSPEFSVGVVGLTHCDFDRCVFQGIGFTGAPEFIERLRREMSGLPDAPRDPSIE